MRLYKFTSALFGSPSPRFRSLKYAMSNTKGDAMNQISKRLEQAFDAARAMTPDQQDLLAVELLERARSLAMPSTKLTAEERAELEAELAAARRGEYATDEEVAAMFAKHGL